jgi:hypothetical protein
MINRRRFVAALGASAVTPVASALWSGSGGATLPRASGARSLVSLNGTWERYVGGVLYDVVSVPSSQRPMGFYHLRRGFLLPRLSSHQRVFLHFDAITYYGEVSVNGERLGAMGPYVPYEFEFTAQAKEGENHVEVGIADLTPTPDGRGEAALELGVNPGWEAYGGIIRDVYAEVRPAVFIENVQWGYDLKRDDTAARCQARVFVSSRGSGAARVHASLEEGVARVAYAERSFQLRAGVTEVRLPFSVAAPALWSPERPNLYELGVSLESEEGEDRWSTRTGFREVRIEGNQFLLNGERLVLKGVCRHDMWKGEGFTLTAAQMEQDMRMIKELGCNFVRLVHYPHHRRIIELADELGLLVSEEPGYWGMDFTRMSEAMKELGYETMERTIRRDWNSPSVLAWLLGNECKLTVEYLKEGKARCRKLDPLNRPVSFANDMPMEEAKPIFEQAGMDFFDQHIYTYNLDDFTHAARFYGISRPLTFSEWGGRAIGQSEIVMEHTVERLMDLIEVKVLAGHSFWSWEDMRQYSRIDGEMHNGILESGVVTENREPREVPYMELARLFAGRHEAEKPANRRAKALPLRSIPWDRNSRFTPLDLQPLVDGADGRRSWGAFERRLASFWAKSRMARDQWKRTGERFLLWQGSEVKVAGVRFLIPVADGLARPLILTPEVPEVVIPVGQECTRLHILGQVTLPSGFPITGRRGELVATYQLLFPGGEQEEFSLRNGIEVAQANRIYEATRINPVATAAQPALEFVKDVAREDYQINLLTIPLRKPKLESLRCILQAHHPPLALFAVTVERTSAVPMRSNP